MNAIRGLSSMATQSVLAELTQAFEAQTSQRVVIESVGGVLAAERVRAGEVFDIVLLAKEGIEKLLATGHLLGGSEVEWLLSPIAIAVRNGATKPSVHNEEALKQTVRSAPYIGISTGPSGVALTHLFERWGLSQELQGRLVTAPPGIPVGALVARGEVFLGFQQKSELQNVQGIEVLGTLPESVGIVSAFSAAVATLAKHPNEAQAFIAFLSSPEAAKIIRHHGMEPSIATEKGVAA